MKSNNIIVDKSKSFALRIIKLFRYLTENHRIASVAKQILKSGTSIGANVKEAVRAQSKPDFYSKMNIALKECSETEGWLQLLFNTNSIDEDAYKKYRNLCGRIRRMLIASCKTLKENTK